MKKFTASIFIIPNKMSVVSSDEFGFKGWNSKLGFYGFPEIQDGDIPVQIWTTSPEIDSWNNHGIPEDLMETIGLWPDSKKCFFPELWPSSVFEGLKEGESITLSGNGFKIELTACQLDYRYKTHGSFEEVFLKVTT